MTDEDRSKVAISMWVCVIAIGLVLVIYIDRFGSSFNAISRAELGTFGDYFGGLLNPIFAAANLVVLVYISLWVARNDRQRESREERLQKMIALYSIRQQAFTKLIAILDKVHLVTFGSYDQSVEFEMGKINIELGVFLSTNLHVFPDLSTYDRQAITNCIKRLGSLTQAYFSAVAVPFSLEPLDPDRAKEEKAAMLVEIGHWNQFRSELTGILISYMQLD